MLEVKNLCRTYKTKKGVEVKALDNVNLRIPNKGMVFILGKSGSGKSTLLNVLGGLDKYDSGEIIIKGKSSKDFSQSDFDSYRNTYLGFIFQEYNILDEFSVGANIALAIELQGRKPTNNEINSIMSDVDLVGYGNRKPNELSGGQKQRVAIARALVKNPEIIMADEPTGALDSKTGQQVFDTLKHLSKEKLVIVVSHDREFAEMYGDRVIELADGKIISDIEKHYVAGEVKSEGIRVVDNRIIQVKAGYQLSNEELQLIGKYIARANSTTYISLDKRINETLKKTSRIDEAGNFESFKDTNQATIAVDGDESKFKLIKSKLSHRHSLKIGASGLKVKPVRLFLTILLSFVAFGLFGLADTMGAYNKVDTAVQSIIDSEVKNVTFNKLENIENTNYTSSYQRKMSTTDLAFLETETGVKYHGIYQDNDTSISSFYNDSSKIDYKNQAYYRGTMSGYIELTNTELSELGFSVVGRMPQVKNEIVITDYIYDHFALTGYKYNNTVLNANQVTKEKMIDGTRKISFGSSIFTIVGIIDTNLDEERYKKFKEREDNASFSIADYVLQGEFESVINYGFHSLFYVCPGTITDIAPKGVYVHDFGWFNNLQSDSIWLNIDRVTNLSTVSGHFFDSTKTTLANDELLVPYAVAIDMIRNDPTLSNAIVNYDEEQMSLAAAYQENEYAIINKYIDDTYSVNGTGTKEEYRETVNMAIYDSSNSLYKEVTEALKKGYIKFIGDYALNAIKSAYPNGKSVTGEYLIYVNEGTHNFSHKIVGFVEENVYVFSDKFINDFTGGNTGVYSFAIGIMPESKNDIKKVVNFYYDSYDEKGIDYKLSNEVQGTLDQVSDFIEIFSNVFTYVGIGFAVFASLMLFNFISISISYKKREIGILRAVGARSKDVFSIFFNESLIISLINFVLASIGATVVVVLLNGVLRNEYGLLITFLNIGLRQYLLILAVSIGVAFISSFFPVYRIAKKRPIDAIKNK